MTDSLAGVDADTHRPGATTHSGGRARRRRSTSSERAGVAAVAAVAALVVVVAAESAPTTIGWVDALYRAAVTVLVVVAAARARRWSLVIGAGLTAVAATGQARFAALVALALVVALVFSSRRHRVLGALAGGLIATASFHLDVGGPLGLETLLALAATSPILVSAYRYSPRRIRRSARRTAVALAASAVALVAISGLAAALSTTTLNAAIDATRAGITEVSDGDDEAAAASFELATERFGEARARVGAWWASGGRLVPLVGANLAPVQDAVRLGGELTASAGQIAAEVDYERIRRPEGGVDLDALAEFEAPMLSAAETLDRASEVLDGVTSPWVVGPLADRLDEFAAEVADLRSQTSLAALAVRDGPALLGADAPRRYLILLGNPAELRDLGGHLGNWVEMVVDDGRFDLVEVGGPLELSIPSEQTPEWLATDFPASFAAVKPSIYPQNWGADPDLPTVADLAGRQFEHVTGRSVDGVLYADTAAFAALLSLTGPVTLSGLPEPVELSSGNAEEFLTREQFVRYGNESEASAPVERAIEDAFERLVSTQLPGPRSLADSFGPLVNSGRFLMATSHEDDEELLTRTGLRGAMPEPDGGDALAVLQRNANPSKIDSFLRRSTQVDFQWNPTSGTVTSVVSVTLANDASGDLTNRLLFGNDAGAPQGTNVTDLTIVTPFRLEVARVEGVNAAAQPLHLGPLWRHTVRVAVPPGGATTVEFHLSGEVDPGETYRLRYRGQPILGEHVLSVTRSSPDGAGGPAERLVVDGDTSHVFSWSSGSGGT